MILIILTDNPPFNCRLSLDLERLKNYWQTPALVFIAIFKKISNNQGYFNQFINPISKRKIFYPEFEGIEDAGIIPGEHVKAVEEVRELLLEKKD